MHDIPLLLFTTPGGATVAGFADVLLLSRALYMGPTVHFNTRDVSVYVLAAVTNRLQARLPRGPPTMIPIIIMCDIPGLRVLIFSRVKLVVFRAEIDVKPMYGQIVYVGYILSNRPC